MDMDVDQPPRLNKRKVGGRRSEEDYSLASPSMVEFDEDLSDYEPIRRGSLDHRRVILGVCAMQKKSSSNPMKEILKRLDEFLDFTVIIFDDQTILEKPIEEWPICDCLISFFSSGFPLKKALEYVQLRRPFLINDLKAQEMLLDRHMVYSVLQQNDIPVPRFAVVRRDRETMPSLIVEEDSIYVNGERFDKPFVEKPTDSEDHKIVIYFPRSAGGGSQHLFRKVADRSSQFCPEENFIRTDGSYLYEDFLPTQGTDVKVYTVGPNYFHAEARKSPAVDGRVTRGMDGKEVRYPIILTAQEKEIAMKVTLAFKQTVCGFDLLRANGKSYVCDVNGWSFVKNSVKYYDDCANILREIMLRKVDPGRMDMRMLSLGPIKTEEEEQEGYIAPVVQKEELRCVIAVTRHGDRTPKQKMKMVVTNEQILSFFNNYGVDTRKEVKLKSPSQLQRLLDITRLLLASRTGDEDSDIEESVEKLKQMRAVLEKGGKFSGINRKVQIKPLKWGEVRDGQGVMKEVVEEALLILKWGGELTTAGRAQAEKLGHNFRKAMYPGEDGLLRLHSTYRHDLKIYASDEGRVQMTAASFAKGLLDLEGELPPILVSLVQKDQTSYDLLDDASAALPLMQNVKKQLHDMMAMDEQVYPDKVPQYVPTGASSLVDSVREINNPRQALQRILDLLERIVSEMKEKVQLAKMQENEVLLYEGETILLMYKRYQKLFEDFFRKKKDKFDISKLPDIYDCVKYDILHNQATLQMESLQLLYDAVKPLADFVVPQEYGMDFHEKRLIGQKMCQKLIEKIILDLDTASARSEASQHVTETFFKLDERFSKDIKIKSPGRHVRTRLYFTSESHIQSLFNVLRFGSPTGKRVVRNFEKLGAIDELNYLTMMVFRLYEKMNTSKDDPTRFRVAISFSPGISTNFNQREKESHVLPFVPLFSLNPSVTLKELEEFLKSALIPEEGQGPASASE